MGPKNTEFRPEEAWEGLRGPENTEFGPEEAQTGLRWPENTEFGPEEAWIGRLIILLFAFYLLLTQVFKRNKPAAEETSRQESTPIMHRVRAKTPSEMDDAELFTYIDSIIRRDNLYLDPLLSREILMSRIKGLSTHRIGTAFSKGSAFKSFPGYILSLRMDYAAELLRSHPDLNIKDVGEASGFANNSTFCTNFKACYGMTPSAYRKAQSK